MDYFNRLAGQQHKEDESKSREEERLRLKLEIQKKLPGYTQNMKIFGLTDPKEIDKIKGYMKTIIKNANTPLPVYEQTQMINEMVLEITNLGPLSPYMEDPEVQEIMINSKNEVFIERRGHLERTPVKFKEENDVKELGRKIAAYVSRVVDTLHPFVDARLPDGSRVHIIIPPVSRKGTTITIRKFFTEKLTINDLIKFQTLDAESARFLEALVVSRANIIVSGGTSSGKTTTLNVLSNFIPDSERIITVEDSAELQLNNSHVVSLETKNPNSEGQGEVTIQDLVKQTLRMRPDRIVVGEVRDNTAYDLLNAMNTGHDGSLATIHANDPDNCVNRMVNLVLERGMEINYAAVRSLVANAVDIVVQVSKMSDKNRRIEYISEVVVSETGAVETHPIFRFDINGFTDEGKMVGEFVRTDYMPSKSLIAKFKSHNIDITPFAPKGVN